MTRPLGPLLRLQHLVRAALRDALVDLDLTPVQNTVLHLLADAPGKSSAELARQTHKTPQTMHKLIAELEQRGLLTLQPRPGHGRILDARLTDKGQALRADASVRARAIEDRMITGLNIKERRQLRDLLEHCVTALEDPSTD